MLGCSTLSPKRNVGLQNPEARTGVLGCKTLNSAEILVFPATACKSGTVLADTSRPQTKKKTGTKKKRGAKKNSTHYPHVNCHHAAMAQGKGKGKEKGKSKLRGQHALVCWTCGQSGHVVLQCPSGRVSALDESLLGEVEDPGDQTWFEEDWTSGDWSED